MTTRRMADLLILSGLSIAVCGVALINPPLALVVAGMGLAAFGALVVQVKP